ncbi:MAG: phosphatase PAP2 family protein [Solirubrobacteraceae bacterium]
MKLAPAVVLGGAALAPVALCVALPRSRPRDLALCALNMWGYLAAYEMPHDDPDRHAARVRVGYPIVLDRALGFGVPPTVRLQQAFARPGSVGRFERVLAWCHWVWFMVPHGSVAYVLLRDPDRFPAAAARMYAVFDLGAVCYWVIPTAPPWWAAARGELDSHDTVRVRRLMIEYGAQFWGDRWPPLYHVLGGNPLAAMPSLHFATSLMAAHLLAEVGPVAGGLGWTYALMLALALVYLGEHYAVDLLGGAALTEAVRGGAHCAAQATVPLARLLQALQVRAATA